MSHRRWQYLDELSEHILRFCNFATLLNVELVSRTWRAVVQHNLCWKALLEARVVGDAAWAQLYATHKMATPQQLRGHPALWKSLYAHFQLELRQTAHNWRHHRYTPTKVCACVHLVSLSVSVAGAFFCVLFGSLGCVED